jgi:DNA-binding response OmpR family regulator
VTRVLLIDDNPVQAAARSAVLRTAGFDVNVANDARTAMESLESSSDVAAVITDHVMPEVSGAEFVRMLRRIDQEVPVLVISGMAGAEDEYEGLNVTFKLKPCPPPEMIDTVRAMVSSREDH